MKGATKKTKGPDAAISPVEISKRVGGDGKPLWVAKWTDTYGRGAVVISANKRSTALYAAKEAKRWILDS